MKNIMKIQREPTIKELRQRVENLIEKEKWVYREDYYISKRKLFSILKELLEPVEEERSVEEMLSKKSVLTHKK
jgi:hypothetical protein